MHNDDGSVWNLEHQNEYQVVEAAREGRLRDDKGVKEPELLAVPVAEPRFAEYKDIKYVPTHLLREIENFFDIY
jgi:inorganic pyrophosphatase